MALIGAVVSSPIPLVATAYLLLIIVSRPLTSLLPDALHGEVEFGFDHSLKTNHYSIKSNNHSQGFTSVGLLHSYLFLSFHTRGKYWLLWRDSCDEATYRQLLVRLKLKQER